MVYKRGYPPKEHAKPDPNKQFVVVRQETDKGMTETAINVNFVIAVARTGPDEYQIEVLGIEGFTCSRADCQDLLNVVGLDAN